MSIKIGSILATKDKKVDVNDTIELVEQSRAGCRDAFDKLVRIYQRRGMQTAVRMLGDVNDASEAVQAGFVKAYLNIKKLKDPARFESWLLRIITNTAINQRRKRNRSSEKVNIENGKFVSLHETADATELKQAIQKAMSKLSKKQAKAISLFGLQDMSHKQVAEIMNCSVEAVRWHVNQARKKLKVFLNDYIK